MSAINYTTKTATLKATLADIALLNAKNLKSNSVETDELKSQTILLGGQDITSYIQDVASSAAAQVSVTIKDAEDTRLNVTSKDLWSDYVELKNGVYTIHHDELSGSVSNGKYFMELGIYTLEDNKLLGGFGELIANIQTEKVMDAADMFYNNIGLQTVSGNFKQLRDASNMFADCKNINDVILGDTRKLENATGMFAGCVSLGSIEGEFSNVSKASGMFTTCSALTKFTASNGMPKLKDATNMFYQCGALIEVDLGDSLEELEVADYMFLGTSISGEFNANMPKLKSAAGMFTRMKSTEKITAFSSELPRLEDGMTMFEQCTFSQLHKDLPSLTNGARMFRACAQMQSFVGDLSALQTGYQMFQNCQSLTEIITNLNSLTNGYQMFTNCKLNTKSLIHIADTIKDVRGMEPTIDGSDHMVTYDDLCFSLDLGIANSEPTQEEIELLNEIHDKGWDVRVNGSSYTPSAASAVMTLDDPEGQVQPNIKPFYAKAVRVDKELANYVNANGEYFDIVGGQFLFVNDPETYGMFTCEEDAAMNMGLTPYVYTEE